MATLGNEEISVVVPEEFEGRVDFIETELGGEIVVAKKVEDLKVKAETGTTSAMVGKKVADSKVTGKAEKGDITKVVFQTTKVNDNDITVKGKGAGDIQVNTGRFNNSSITFKKKSNDSVEFNNGVEVRNATIDGGKGADTITFKENAAIKGTNEITLGQGRDVLELPANKTGKGSIVVTDLQNKDTIKIGDESFSGKDILDGNVELPDYITIQAMD